MTNKTKRFIPALTASLLVLAIANSSYGQIKIIINETNDTVAFGGSDSGTPERIVAPFINTYEYVAGWETGSLESTAEVLESNILVDGPTVTFEAFAYPSNGSQFQFRLHFQNTNSTTIQGTNTAYTQSDLLLSESEWNTLFGLSNGRKLAVTDGSGFSPMVVVRESSETYEYYYHEESDTEWIYDYIIQSWAYAEFFPWINCQGEWMYIAEFPWVFFVEGGWAYLLASENGAWIYFVETDTWKFVSADAE
ncbi:hypothetical protein [Rubellicoccus peritrichatus]|uniref:Uncharacterized protein n=1 Tax=Rubellicoccus peritrichatus TaxID=3080537 RepID=A0AAQ3L872_9BACT|nr:hypothetical protein [Puniceicoccus sp. CR14]WOO41090.1 hypothetical protein RZN69_20920 [Puniceicoccus sp. CR14]